MSMNVDRFSGEYVANRKELHNAVRAAAGNRCIRCLHPEGDTPSLRVTCDDRCTHPQDGKMRILTVHHLNGKKDDNRWWNLLALCQSCHLTIQGRVIPERPWLFEHSPWFIPYVCGFYASYYGSIEITREEADATPDRWLAMGQPWMVPKIDWVLCIIPPDWRGSEAWIRDMGALVAVGKNKRPDDPEGWADEYLWRTEDANDLRALGRCRSCLGRITLRQVGLCVYSEPCGHYRAQGDLSKMLKFIERRRTTISADRRIALMEMVMLTPATSAEL